MNIKRGDKVYCFKDINSGPFYKDIWYTVDSVKSEYPDDPILPYDLDLHNFFINDNCISICIDEYGDVADFFTEEQFHSHFYTEKELRMLKLLKIQNKKS